MQLRRQSTSVEKVVVQVRNSLMEPALRLQHSLQDATHKSTATTWSREPALHLPTSSSAATPHHAKIKIVQQKGVVQAPLGPVGTASRIVQREGFWALYKGLTAVYTGIIPKMAIRFVAFEQYRDGLQQVCAHNNIPTTNSQITFVAGLASGLTEAIMVVTPAEVCKIRMQSQYHSLMDATARRHQKYTNVLQTAYTIVKEEGFSALYKGVIPTMARQGINQAVNFTAYNYTKAKVMEWQHTEQLEHWQSLLIGGLSGGIGPLCNNPLDVAKTRLQKQVVTPGKTPKYSGLVQTCFVVAKEEGVLALWKGITPRLLRIMPGQAITFMTYEAVSSQMTRMGFFQ